MRTIKKIRSQDKTDGYFENLPKSTQEIVKERILDAAENRHGPEGWSWNDKDMPVTCPKCLVKLEKE